jgi:DNA-directed RNA polymerase specialized sigma24 family protein
MPHKKPDNFRTTSWPDIEVAYVDEFGPIDPIVYAQAGTLWPLVEPLVLRTLRDGQNGQRLMMKAVALVSRKLAEQPERMINLKSYLFQAFRHLLFEELEKLTGHAQRDAEVAARITAIPQRSEDEINRIVLIHEILQRADNWTRETFELLSLGYTFDEIARECGMKANFVRSRLSKRLQKLADQVRKEELAAERKTLKGRLAQS